MKTVIVDGGVDVTREHTTFQLRTSRWHARLIVRDMHRIMARDPGEKYWRMDTTGSIRVACTRLDPWPTIALNGSTTFRPTASELMNLLEKLDDYGHGRKR